MLHPRKKKVSHYTPSCPLQPLLYNGYFPVPKEAVMKRFDCFSTNISPDTVRK